MNVREKAERDMPMLISFSEKLIKLADEIKRESSKKAFKEMIFLDSCLSFLWAGKLRIYSLCCY